MKIFSDLLSKEWKINNKKNLKRDINFEKLLNSKPILTLLK